MIFFLRTLENKDIIETELYITMDRRVVYATNLNVVEYTNFLFQKTRAFFDYKNFSQDINKISKYNSNVLIASNNYDKEYKNTFEEFRKAYSDISKKYNLKFIED